MTVSPPIRSVHVIRRVPCTSVTCLLCTSNDSQDNLGFSEVRTLLVPTLLHNTYYSKIQKPLEESTVRLIHLRVYSVTDETDLPRTHPPRPPYVTRSHMYTGPFVIEIHLVLVLSYRYTQKTPCHHPGTTKVSVIFTTTGRILFYNS